MPSADDNTEEHKRERMIIIRLLMDLAEGPFNDGTHTIGIGSICAATHLTERQVIDQLRKLSAWEFVDEPTPSEFKISNRGYAQGVRSIGEHASTMPWENIIASIDPAPAIASNSADAWHQGFACALAELCRCLVDYKIIRRVMSNHSITPYNLEIRRVNADDLETIRRAFVDPSVF